MIRKIEALLCALVICLIPMNSFAADTSELIFTARDEMLSITAPEDLDLYEFDGDVYYRYPDEAPEYAYESVFSLENDDLLIYYDQLYLQSGAGNNGFTTKENAVASVSRYKDVLNDYLDEDYSFSLGSAEPVFIKSDSLKTGWLRYRCEDCNIYVNVVYNTAIRLMIATPNYSSEFTDAERQTANAAVKSFADDGYTYEQLMISQDDLSYDEYYEDDTYYDEYGESDNGGWIGILVTIVISLLSAAGAKYKKESGKPAKTLVKPTKVKADDFGSTVRTAKTDKFGQFGKNAKFNMPDLSKLKSLAPHSDRSVKKQTLDGRRSSTYSCSYEDSMKTLVKSGIMTQKEYKEMVTKHYLQEEKRRMQSKDNGEGGEM